MFWLVLHIWIDPNIEAAYRWDIELNDFQLISPTNTLPSGTVFWLLVHQDATIKIIGDYLDPPKLTIPAGEHYLPSFGLETFSLKNIINLLN